eukprot:scaffold2557_cov121-Cylindrotheca_fusiformis.AAC.12
MMSKDSMRFAVVFFILLLVVLSLRQDLSSFIPKEITETDAEPVVPKGTPNPQVTEYSDLNSIRSWGCHRTETPLIFVHIGKSGGGSVRARFAAAATNVTRHKMMRDGWKFPKEDSHYYPVASTSTFQNGTEPFHHRGQFCASKNRHYRLPDVKRSSQEGFEGIFDCHATTPIGKIVGCPSFWIEDEECGGCADMNAPNCHTVYVGHNYFGNELHWLPVPYIQEWWNNNWASALPSPVILDGFRSVYPESRNPLWCPLHNKSRTTKRNDVLADPMRRRYHEECSKEVSNQMDALFQASWNAVVPDRTKLGKNYAPIYASMPLHRTVLLREPFSWLVSRFFWNSNFNLGCKCDDIAKGTFYDAKTLDYSKSGWVYKMALEHIFYLCGEDCINRYETGEIGLEDMERQAEANLRHSFSVVGLLNETKSFYEMVTTRIQYVDMFNNLDISGPLHSSTGYNRLESSRCSALYSGNETFRQMLRDASPQLQALERLYKVGVMVNRAQKEELRTCAV